MTHIFSKIKALAALVALFAFAGQYCRADSTMTNDLPDSIFVGGQKQHVQGIALDREKGFMYMSFTSRFVKTDLKGNIIASIDRIQGHLGAMTFNPKDRKVYASLECKDDEIGAGVAKTLNVAKIPKGGSSFYIAIIDVDKMNRIGIDPEKDEMFKTVLLKEPAADYNADVEVDGLEMKHRYGCSGIDGVTIAPAICKGKKTGKEKLFLYVAYGIYGSLERNDDNYQIILRYGLESLEKYAKTITFGTIHESGPDQPLDKYFIYTGNSTYGVQNMAYDPFTGNIFLAVYKGKKPAFPNYDLFAFSVNQKPFRQTLSGVPYSGKQLQLNLADEGMEDRKTGVRGWHFKWGSTGLCPISDGYWYISENARDSVKLQSCNARLYKWTGDASKPFKPAR